MKKVVIFGGGGYCGSVLIPQLVAEGWNVTVFDTFWYGTGHLAQSPNLRLVTGDVSVARKFTSKVQELSFARVTGLRLAGLQGEFRTVK